MLPSLRFTRLLTTSCSIRPTVNLVRSYSSKEDKRKGVLKINLMDESDKVILSCTIDEAKRYAAKNNMILVNYEGPVKTTKNKQMQVLSKSKLSDAELDKKEVKVNKKKNEIKKIIISDSITEHDLDTKTKKIAFYLNKGNSVRLVISGFKIEQKMGILNKIKQKFTPHLSFKQVSSNSTQIKLIVVPGPTFAAHYTEIYKKDEINMNDEEDNDDENELLEDDLEELINEKLK